MRVTARKGVASHPPPPNSQSERVICFASRFCANRSRVFAVAWLMGVQTAHPQSVTGLSRRCSGVASLREPRVLRHPLCAKGKPACGMGIAHTIPYR